MADRIPGDRAEAEDQGACDPKVSAGLFVGVSSFEDERILAVPCAVNDAVDLAHLFTMELGLVLPERTVLLLAGKPRKPESIERLERLVEHGARLRSARMSDIYRYLGELTLGTEERGLFVLTVATHGVSVQGDDFVIATDSLQERILRTGVSVAEMVDQVASAGAGRRLVLFDASRERLLAGTRDNRRLNTPMQGKGEVPAPTFAKAIPHATGLAVLSSATLGGLAYDDWERKNGVFTAAVLDGLRGEASVGPDGWITVRALASFCQERVAAWVRLHRPDHTAISRGITVVFEGTVEALPLAFHPESERKQQQYYRSRREAALARFKENQGRVLTGAMWDQVVAGLPVEEFSPEAARLLEKIEILDGTERAQRCLRDFLRELASEVNPPLRNEEGWNKEMPAGFDVFLSHNSKDKPSVRELAIALRARGLKVWLDEWELVPGRPWQEALEEIIETTRCSAVLVSKDGLGPWQDEEMRGCLSEFVSRKVPVIPVLLPGAPEAPKLPFFLRRFTWVDLREGLTEEGIDRLQWGITGKRPDRSKLPSPPAAPRITLHGPAFHVEQIPFTLVTGLMKKSTFAADILSLIVINSPQNHAESSAAKGLKAEFTCEGNEVRLPWIDARLDYSAQPSQLSRGQMPELTFDLGIDQWKKINLIIKEKDAEDCHLFNNDSFYHPRAQNPAWKIPSGEYKLLVRVAGIGVREQFECTFINPGRGASLAVKSL